MTLAAYLAKIAAQTAGKKYLPGVAAGATKLSQRYANGLLKGEFGNKGKILNKALLFGGVGLTPSAVVGTVGNVIKGIQNQPRKIHAAWEGAFFNPAQDELGNLSATLDPRTRAETMYGSRADMLNKYYGTENDSWKQYLANQQQLKALNTNAYGDLINQNIQAGKDISGMGAAGAADIRSTAKSGAGAVAATNAAGSGTNVSGMRGTSGANARMGDNMMAQGDAIASYLQNTIGLSATEAKQRAADMLVQQQGIGTQVDYATAEAQRMRQSKLDELMLQNEMEKQAAIQSTIGTPRVTITDAQARSAYVEWNSMNPAQQNVLRQQGVTDWQTYLKYKLGA